MKSVTFSKDEDDQAPKKKKQKNKKKASQDEKEKGLVYKKKENPNVAKAKKGGPTFAESIEMHDGEVTNAGTSTTVPPTESKFFSE